MADRRLYLDVAQKRDRATLDRNLLAYLGVDTWSTASDTGLRTLHKLLRRRAVADVRLART